MRDSFPNLIPMGDMLELLTPYPESVSHSPEVVSSVMAFGGFRRRGIIAGFLGPAYQAYHAAFLHDLNAKNFFWIELAFSLLDAWLFELFHAELARTNNCRVPGLLIAVEWDADKLKVITQVHPGDLQRLLFNRYLEPPTGGTWSAADLSPAPSAPVKASYQLDTNAAGATPPASVVLPQPPFTAPVQAPCPPHAAPYPYPPPDHPLGPIGLGGIAPQALVASRPSGPPLQRSYSTADGSGRDRRAWIINAAAIALLLGTAWKAFSTFLPSMGPVGAFATSAGLAAIGFYLLMWGRELENHKALFRWFILLKLALVAVCAATSIAIESAPAEESLNHLDPTLKMIRSLINLFSTELGVAIGGIFYKLASFAISDGVLLVLEKIKDAIGIQAEKRDEEAQKRIDDETP